MGTCFCNFYMKFLTCSWCLYMFQLIIATMPDPKHGKLPSIVTEDNIQLLFEIQKKVLRVLVLLFFYSI